MIECLPHGTAVLHSLLSWYTSPFFHSFVESLNIYIYTTRLLNLGRYLHQALHSVTRYSDYCCKQPTKHPSIEVLH